MYPALLNPLSHHKNRLYVKYGNSPKLSQKTMKPALECSFYLKIKNETNRLIGMFRMIDPLSSTLPPSCNSRRGLKKS